MWDYQGASRTTAIGGRLNACRLNGDGRNVSGGWRYCYRSGRYVTSSLGTWGT
ncbi:unnamed protein product, partial [Ectocarpus sp. 13 AM-2016]